MAQIVHAVVVCVLVLALDITAGILGLQAQAAENKAKECEKPVHTAYHLGRTALLLLLVAEILSHYSSFCKDFKLHSLCPNIMFSQSTSISRKLSALAFVIAVAAVVLLMVGFRSNADYAKTSCGFVRNYSLAIGGIICFVHGVVTVAVYVAAVAGPGERIPSRRPPAAQDA